MTEDVSSAWPAEAVTALVDRYERPLLAYACRMLGGDWQGAQDAVQETFLRLCRENREKIESRVAAWLFSVCRSRVIDMQRTNHTTPIDASQVTVADPAPDASQIASEAEEKTSLPAWSTGFRHDSKKSCDCGCKPDSVTERSPKSPD